MAKSIWCCRRPELEEYSYRKSASDFSAVFGILLNVSGSLQSSNEDVDNLVREPWAKYIFQMIHDIIKYDLSSENRIFAFASGGTGSKQTKDVDILRTLEKFQKNGCISDLDLPATEEHIEQFFSFVEERGARTIRRWIKPEKLSEVVSDLILITTLNKLKLDKKFRKYFIYELLPKGCRDWVSESTAQTRLRYIWSRIANSFQCCVAAVVAPLRSTANDHEEIKEVLNKTLPELVECPSKSKSVFTVNEAFHISNGFLDNPGASRNFFRSIEPVFQGEIQLELAQQNPLCRILEKSVKLFSSTNQDRGVRKVLLILSDGRQTDIQSLEQMKKRFSEQNVTIVCCYLLRRKRWIRKPKCLYSEVKEEWTDGAKYLFSLSSAVPNDLLPRALLLKEGWEISFTNDKTRLFIEINDERSIRYAYRIVRDTVFCREALSDFLSLAYLDFFINAPIQNQKASDQKHTLTCYAYASATVLYLTFKRRLSQNKHPNFEDLKNEIIATHGTEGGYPFEVLTKMFKKYHLKCDKVELEGALKAITEKRPVVTTFYFTKTEWDSFRKFYRLNPHGILTKHEIDVDKRDKQAERFGLTSFNSQCLMMMNSWGESWGDRGFFRVQSVDVFDQDLEFVDVYWTTKGGNRETHGADVAKRIQDKLNGMQRQTFKCPKCKKESSVTSFTGSSLLRVTCPRCKGPFRIEKGEKGNILALNMYLLSLTR